MRRCSIAVVAAVVLTALALTGRAEEPARLAIGKFSSQSADGQLPKEWIPLTFKNVERHTHYALVKDGDAVVVKAVAHAAASGLVHRIRIDPREYPIVEWRWRVDNVLQKGDVGKKAGDDYPARVYVTFEYDPKRASLLEAAKFRAARALHGPDLPFRALSYIWESKASKGSIVPNPYTASAMMIVVQSGSDGIGRWIVEERNVYDDFKKAFNEEPPMISGIAIMTDTDNTQESATAYYGDIVFKKAK